MDDSITIKGIKDGLLITLAPDDRWSEQVKRLVKLIEAQGNFFNGAQVTLAVGSRDLRQRDLANAQDQLKKHQVNLIGVLSESMNTQGAALKLGLNVDLASSDLETRQVEVIPKPPPIDPEERGTPGVLINHTLRNGRTVHSDGHAVILGDVNAGAVVVAAGDVIVWGRLRGVVHAGAQGNENAKVCALHLAPTQLRIAGYITISPDDRRRRPKPEMAMVRNGRIEAVAWEITN